jgi:hypothetical protein
MSRLIAMRTDYGRPDFKPRPLDYIEFLNWETISISQGGASFAHFSVLEGEIDEALVLGAWRTLCLRHPMLGATVQKKREKLQFVPLPEFPALQVRTVSKDAVVEELLASVGEFEFPSGAPLYRSFAVLNRSTGRHVFLTVINHAAGDGDACLRLHKEFLELLNAGGTCGTNLSTMNRTLPCSWCETVLPTLRPWHFFRSGVIELTRRLHCDMVPFETLAPFSRRQTRHLITVADVASTQSLIKRASEEYGINAFLSARLLEVQLSYMAERGLVGNRAKLVLTLPMNLRRLSMADGGISMGTFPHFAGVHFERHMGPRTASQRIRAAIDEFTGPKALNHIVNWYSPLLTRRGLEQLLNRNIHLGPYTTHLGRLELRHEQNVRCIATFGFLNMRHCLNSLQLLTSILNDRLVVAINYCEPIVGSISAEVFFRQFLNQIGIDPIPPIVDNYDHFVQRVLETEHATT